MSPLSWLRRHDPGLRALRRAGRVAIVMPLFGKLFDLHAYAAAFWIATAAGLCGYLGWLWLSRESAAGPAS